MSTFDVYENQNQAVRDAYAMLAANIQLNNKQNKPQSIIITSCNPQEGKTTLAINLSIAIANTGLNVLLIDADMRKPNNTKRLYQNFQVGLSECIMGKADLDDAIVKTNIKNLSYLHSGSNDPNPMALLLSARFDELINKVTKDYDLDYIIYDTPALTSVADGALVASKGDATLLVVKMGHTKIPDLKRVKEYLERMDVTILGFVLNEVKKQDYVHHFRAYDYFFKAGQFSKNNKTGKKAYNKNEVSASKQAIFPD